MSFQRSLTGESTIYANVVLNTNICASSVSTVNLSATNASFVNLTTTTWTTGNISTPNVIATSGYFSTVYMSTLNLSTFNTPTASVSQAYISNLSTSNISNSSLISTSTLRAYIVNVSTENSCLVNTSSIYSTYGYVTNISVSNICIATALDVDGDVIGVNGNFEHLQVKNSGGTTQYTIEPISNKIRHNIETTGVTSIELMRLNASLASFTTSQCLFWNPVYTSATYTSNLSSSNISNSSLISTSTLRAYITNVSTENSCLVNTSTLYASYGYVNNFYASIGNFSTLNASNINLASVTTSSITTSTIYQLDNISGTNTLLIKNSGVVIKDYVSGGTTYVGINYDSPTLGEMPGLIFEADASGAYIESDDLPLRIQTGGVDQLVNVSTTGWEFYNTITTSYPINASHVSIETMSVWDTVQSYNVSSDYIQAGSIDCSYGNIWGNALISSTDFMMRDYSFHTLLDINVNTFTSTVQLQSQTPYTDKFIFFKDSTQMLTVADTYSSIAGTMYASVMTTSTINAINTSFTNVCMTNLTAPNTINCNSSATTLALFANSQNTSISNGLRVPNWIDGLALGTGFTIARAHTAGYVNICRPLRVYGGGVLTDSAYNGLVGTQNVRFCDSATTGLVSIGAVTLVNNISVRTASTFYVSDANTSLVSTTLFSVSAPNISNTATTFYTSATSISNVGNTFYTSMTNISNIATSFTVSATSVTMTGTSIALFGNTQAGKTGNYYAEIGNSGSGGTYLDFHSSNTSSDYDSRIVATGGTSILGRGNLAVTAANFTVTTTPLTGSATFNGTTVIGKNGSYYINTSWNVGTTALNFHSAGLGSNNYDTQIVSATGTSGVDQMGTFFFNANSINLVYGTNNLFLGPNNYQFGYVPWTQYNTGLTTSTFMNYPATLPTIGATGSSAMAMYSIIGNTMYLRMYIYAGSAGTTGNGLYQYKVPTDVNNFGVSYGMLTLSTSTLPKGTKVGSGSIKTFPSAISANITGSVVVSNQGGNNGLLFYFDHGSSTNTYQSNASYPLSTANLMLSFDANLPLGL